MASKPNQVEYLAHDLIWPKIEGLVQNVATAAANTAVAANNANMGSLVTPHLAKALSKTAVRESGFAGSPARAVTYQAIVHWNEAYKWGNHASQNYWQPDELLDADFKTTGILTVGGIRLQKNGKEIKPYSGPLHDSHGVKIADVLDGLIVDVIRHNREA